MGKEIFIQLIGILGAIFGFIAYQKNEHKKIMLYKTSSELTFALQFILLGAYTGVAMNVIGCVRNLVFARQVKKNKSTAAGIILFSLLMAAAGALTWTGPVCLLAIAGKIFTTLAYGMKNPQKVRLLTLPSSGCWLIYDVVCRSLGGIVTEVFTVVSIVIAEVRFRKKKGEKAAKQAAEATEAPTSTK